MAWQFDGNVHLVRQIRLKADSQSSPNDDEENEFLMTF